MSEWKEYKLGELTIDGKGSYGIAAPAVDYDSNKYTYLRITDINDDGTLNKNGFLQGQVRVLGVVIFMTKEMGNLYMQVF